MAEAVRFFSRSNASWTSSSSMVVIHRALSLFSFRWSLDSVGDFNSCKHSFGNSHALQSQAKYEVSCYMIKQRKALMIKYQNSLLKDSSIYNCLIAGPNSRFSTKQVDEK